jgi:hypothetical protein
VKYFGLTALMIGELNGYGHLKNGRPNEWRETTMKRTYYATINLPGSSHFEYYGPAPKAESEQWLRERVTELQKTEQMTSLLPQRIVSKRDAESWRYRDSSWVVKAIQDDRD